MSIKLSNKLKQVREGMMFHWCPACEEQHPIHVHYEGKSSGPSWKWDGDVDKPTFSPSFRQHGAIMCHYFIKNGKIQYCGDCDHSMKGQTIDLPNLPD